MGKTNKPSLRNFAVLRKSDRSLYGSFYLVRDRRVLTPDQVLFVPSKWRAWPRYLALANNLEHTPVRLRDGRVGILLGSGIQPESLKSFKPAKSKTWTFDAISGFHEGKVRRRHPVLLTTFCSGLVLLMLLPQMLSKPATTKAKEVIVSQNKSRTCSKPLDIDEKFKILQAKVALINGIKYSVVRRTQLGGLWQLQLVRLCDKAPIKLTVWKTEQVFQIDSIG